MSKVLDGEVELDLGAVFRRVMAGEIVGEMHYTYPQQYGWPKAITPAIYAMRRGWGIPIALNFESTGRSWRNGYGAGRNEGTLARTGARECGHPDARPILFSADENVPTNLLPTLADYLRGANSVAPQQAPQGFYGDAEAIDYLFSRGLISVGWQTNARSWDGDSIDDPAAALVQRTSHSFVEFAWNLYDESDVQHADWGQNPAPHPAAPPPPPKVPGPPAPMPPRGAHMQFPSPLALKPIVATQDAPGGGTWALQVDGGVVTLGSAPFHGAPGTKVLVPGDSWIGGKADIRLPIAGDPGIAGGAAHYVCVTNQGRTYGY